MAFERVWKNNSRSSRPKAKSTNRLSNRLHVCKTKIEPFQGKIVTQVTQVRPL